MQKKIPGQVVTWSTDILQSRQVPEEPHSLGAKSHTACDISLDYSSNCSIWVYDRYILDSGLWSWNGICYSIGAYQECRIVFFDICGTFDSVRWADFCSVDCEVRLTAFLCSYFVVAHSDTSSKWIFTIGVPQGNLFIVSFVHLSS